MTGAFEATVAAQRRAANPATSAWVAANAGAGKTRVLTDRVTRLLLAGAEPSRILCITFTKAAAAEMSARLLKRLGEWALMEDAALGEAVTALTGEKAIPSTEELAAARRLFARALETPGGLKIQTIHAFCQSLLGRFPVEAGVAPGFSVLDDGETASMLDEALARLLSHPLDAETEDLNLLLERFDERSFRQHLRNVVARATGEADAALARLADMLDVDPQTAPETLEAAFGARVDRDALREAADAMRAGTKTDNTRADKLFLAADTTPQHTFAALQAALFSAKGEPYVNIVTKKFGGTQPWIEERLRALEAEIAEAGKHISAARIYAESAALHRIAHAVRARYDAAKAARAALDFDDLIAASVRLFEDDGRAAWVLYKLDQGLDHILLDEAQDTAPAQWAVIEAPLSEFLSGEGAREENRTLFVVGDEKQSIYSFQGADVGLFARQRNTIRTRFAEAEQPFVDEPLTLSFRSTAPVLAAVDAIFADPGAANGLRSDDGPVTHGVNRAGDAGVAELWPLIVSEQAAERDAWDAPLDRISKGDPTAQLAERIAGVIHNWLASGERLPSRARAIRADDILILVQTRSAMFHEVIRALSRVGVPVAGADRLKLFEDAAVDDLMALARFALQPGDDLSLAEVLKGPLIGWTDDDLLALAPERTGTLWRALRATDTDKARAAAAMLETLRKAEPDGPYAFFSAALENGALESGAPSGRERFLGRFGLAAAEPLTEFINQALAYERAHPRSLQAFMQWALTQTTDLKREMENAGGAVRVMTVHGAKGLEANIVFLADANRAPRRQESSAPLDLGDGLLAAPVTKENDTDATAAAREAARAATLAEYRRLFYVAATRARDRLYVCGTQGKRAPSETTWHAMAAGGFERLAEEGRAVEAPGPWPGAENEAPVLRLESTQTAEPETDAAFVQNAAAAGAPAWLKTPAPQERAAPRIAPSRIAGEEDAGHAAGRAQTDAALSPAARNADKYFRGRTLHRMLELLPEIAPAERANAAERLLARLAPGVEPQEAQRWRAEVLAVLGDPAFAAVFGPGSRAEVPLVGAVGGATVNGQIDRLIATPGEVLCVDYKTNRPPPRRVEDAPQGYIAQMAAYQALLSAIYPGRPVRCALLWTFEARLMHLPQALLDHACARIGGGG